MGSKSRPFKVTTDTQHPLLIFLRPPIVFLMHREPNSSALLQRHGDSRTPMTEAPAKAAGFEIHGEEVVCSHCRSDSCTLTDKRYCHLEGDAVCEHAQRPPLFDSLSSGDEKDNDRDKFTFLNLTRRLNLSSDSCMCIPIY